MVAFAGSHEGSGFVKAVVQRVRKASVTCGTQTQSIEAGLLVLLGVAENDGLDESDWMAHRISHLRIFSDEVGKMRYAVKDHGLQVLVISQFTLLADTSGGHRPSFGPAAAPEVAEPLYKRVVDRLRQTDGVGAVRTGMFGEAMQVELVNDGPVTIMLDREPTPPLPRC